MQTRFCEILTRRASVRPTDRLRLFSTLERDSLNPSSSPTLKPATRAKTGILHRGTKTRAESNGGKGALCRVSRRRRSHGDSAAPCRACHRRQVLINEKKGSEGRKWNRRGISKASALNVMDDSSLGGGSSHGPTHTQRSSLRALYVTSLKCSSAELRHNRCNVSR